jgi:hypothetical protein
VVNVRGPRRLRCCDLASIRPPPEEAFDKTICLFAALLNIEDNVVMHYISMKRATSVLSLVFFITVLCHASDKDRIVWKALPNAILQVDSRAPKIWNVFQAGKKLDPLLVEIGNRYLVVYVHRNEVYEIKPDKLEHKGDDLVWRETDKPDKPMATSDWSAKDVGSAQRILLKLTDEGRALVIEIPQMPDLRRGIY